MDTDERVVSVHAVLLFDYKLTRLADRVYRGVQRSLIIHSLYIPDIKSSVLVDLDLRIPNEAKLIIMFCKRVKSSKLFLFCSIPPYWKGNKCSWER